MSARSLAIHEAGHAVIGRVLSMVCEGATIEPDGECAGHAIIHVQHVIMSTWERQGKWRAEESVWRGRIMSFMAGREAEAELLGNFEDEGLDGDDRYQIELMAEEVNISGDWEAYEARLRSKTRSLVRRHRSTILLVAGELLSRTTIDTAALNAMVPIANAAAISAARAPLLPFWATD
jgi:hypothetical protein